MPTSCAKCKIPVKIRYCHDTCRHCRNGRPVTMTLPTESTAESANNKNAISHADDENTNRPGDGF